MSKATRFKIDEHDYAILLKAKKEATDLEKENLKHQREETLALYALKIKIKMRELEVKKSQIVEGKSNEKHEAFLDGVKPLPLF